MEREGNQYPDLKRELEKMRFRRIIKRTGKFKIVLTSLQAYLKMRFDRTALRQELLELAPNYRVRFLNELRDGLNEFVHDGKFTIRWNVDFMQATK